MSCLSFDTTLHDIQSHSKVVSPSLSALKRFSTSDNKALQTASNYALWEIGNRDTQLKSQKVEHLEGSRSITSSARLPITRRSLAVRSGSHQIMISYQWDSQPLVLGIRDRLKASGCKVWMDVDKMSKDNNIFLYSQLYLV